MLGFDPPPATTMSHSDARIALACLDLTSLGEDDTPAVAAALAKRANTAYGTPAAICIYPELILATRMSLMREGIPQVRIATVVNFPDGSADADRAEFETRRALAAGADEIDLVFPWRSFQAGAQEAARALVARVKARCGKAELKVILESSAFDDLAGLRAAADTAIAGGADFLKTSTGKFGAAASPQAAACMAAAISAAARPVGLKISGGVRTLADASRYLAIAADLYGRDRVVPARFRIGASALLDELLPVLALEPVDDS
jgi:deoxyribose-phosphate aldolase